MIGPQPAHDDEAVSEWLAERHRDLISDLTGTLDLDAGLRDIAIADDHHALVSDLSDMLDLDSGLAAILPAQEGPGYPTIPQSPSERSPLSTSSTDWVAALAASPAVVRLALRVSALNLAQAVDIVGTLHRANEYVDILMTDPAHAIAQAMMREVGLAIAHADALADALDHADAHDLARAIAHDLDLAHARARTHDLVITLARTIAHDLGIARARTHDLVITLARTIAHDLGIPKTGIVQVENLRAQQLRDVVNDLIGADLYNVNLEGMRLDGVRWSDATRWPTQWIDHIRQHSVDLGNGIYEYRPGNSTVDDGLALASR